MRDASSETVLDGVQGTCKKVCRLLRLGLVPYEKASALQLRLHSARVEGKVLDTVLALEHPPVITLGRAGNTSNILVPVELLAQRGVAVVHSSRGGDITFHNPGQLVVYPIVNAMELYSSTSGEFTHQYINDLEEVVIGTLLDFGIAAGRVKGYRGVWVGDEKVCAIGLSVRQGVTMHGFALNVNNSLDLTAFMHPCGIVDKGVTSMSLLAGKRIEVDEVVAAVARRFSAVFPVTVDYGEMSAEALLAQLESQ